MDFTDIYFWLTLIPAGLLLCLGNWALANKPQALMLFHKCFLLLLSFFLLWLVSWVSLLIFIVVMLLNYAICHAAQHTSLRSRKFIIALSIPLLLAPLLYYKYAYFVGSGILGQNWDTLRDLIIPVGISFYSFQLISFTIDTLLRGMPMPRFLDFMNFGAFFPQIVAGPIERRDSLLPQVENIDLRLKAAPINEGMRYILLGIFYKMVLADNLALGFQAAYEGQSAWVVWWNALLFTTRIYFDFCGYGLCAYGFAKCLGINITMNFKAPLCATSATEFWRRWHISLTTWFRDYVYFPLKGSRTKLWALNILIVFGLSGLWHGANWNYIIWGLFLGMLLIIHRVWSKAGLRLWSPLGFGLTALVTLLSFIIFYENDLPRLLRHWELILTPAAYAAEHLKDMRQAHVTPAAIAMLLTCGVITLEWLSLRKTGNPFAAMLHPVFALIMGFLIVFFPSGANNAFIYFNF